MYIIIVGIGNVGFFLANKLLKDKHKVTLIDKNPTVCSRIAQTSSMVILQGDGSKPAVLKEAKAEKANVVVALTQQDEDNLVISQIAKNIFGVSRTIAKVNNPQNVKVFSALGVDVPIDSTSILARIVEEEASFTDFINLLSIKKGRLSIVRVAVSEKSPVANKQIKDIVFPQDAVLVSILRGNDVVIPRGDTRVSSGDEIIGITSIEKEKELVELLVGKL